ncbi:hypothetical protein [Accumulibacter sp.]|uniref:hypothetical protein n=1 Tax=Accumulibacter sp. TaxID=2053492 RepID=UPI0035B43878
MGLIETLVIDRCRSVEFDGWSAKGYAVFRDGLELGQQRDPVGLTAALGWGWPIRLLHGGAVSVAVNGQPMGLSDRARMAAIGEAAGLYMMTVPSTKVVAYVARTYLRGSLDLTVEADIREGAYRAITITLDELNTLSP